MKLFRRRFKGFYAFILFICFTSIAPAQIGHERSYHAQLYEILNHGDAIRIESRINDMKDIPSKDTMAYIGALRMKLAGILGSPLQKLSTFKEGKKSLEKAISMDSINAEYRFLRLIIQENAPGILAYNHNLEEDKMYIIQKFPKLNEFLKSEIRKYASTSKVLTLANLNE
ncbi:MAG: hypothetical protein EYC69_05110 [Bacteroidetes bacterium]|nr:MAG: hypothetical protein EYC69_05110 [Bacteroidota bacterium]